MADALIYRCAACGGVNRVRPDKLDSHPTCGRCKAGIDREAHPAEVSDGELASLVATAPVPVLVDFWAPWCGPCRMVAPHLATVARQRAGQLIVVKVNTDQHQRTAQKLGIQGIPAFAVYLDGAIVQRGTGAMGPAQLDELVAPHIA